MRVIVVGAGIAGSALVRALRGEHAAVRHIADPAAPPHSAAAATLLRAAYHRRHPGETVLFGRSVELYHAWGVPLLRNGWVTNYRTPGRPARCDDDWLLLDPAAPLLTPDILGRAAPTPGGVTVAGKEFRADAVVWCTGAYRLPAALPPAGPLRLSHGVTFTHADPAVLTQPELLRIHHYGPYKTIAAGHVGAGARLGSSSAASAAVALRQAQAMLAAAQDVGMIRSLLGWRAVTGTRVKAATPGPMRLAGPHWAFVGLHRTGYALAPALAVDGARQLRRLHPAPA